MKNLLIGLTLLTSMSSFAMSYSGEGITDEFGTEQCGMNVVVLENNKLDLTVFGNGLVVKAVVDQSPEISFVTNTEDLPSEEASIFAVMYMDNPSVPVSFQLTSNGEMVECNF
jgi:hypothetical protein